LIAGGVAGAVSRTIVSPLERLKILLQVQSVGRNEYQMSIPKAFVKMWKDEGWKGLMVGNGTNCVRIVPYSAVQFAAYTIYKGVSTTTFPFSLFLFISFLFAVLPDHLLSVFFYALAFFLGRFGRQAGDWCGSWVKVGRLGTRV
jgi:hypothetical protein